jgi:hypothetical protein
MRTLKWLILVLYLFYFALFTLTKQGNIIAGNKNVTNLKQQLYTKYNYVQLIRRFRKEKVHEVQK